MKKALLLLLLILCCILCTACYTDADPFPTSQELGNLQETNTTAPAVPETPPATQAPTAPTVTMEPLPEDAVDVSPNFNG